MTVLVNYRETVFPLEMVTLRVPMPHDASSSSSHTRRSSFRAAASLSSPSPSSSRGAGVGAGAGAGAGANVAAFSADEEASDDDDDDDGRSDTIEILPSTSITEDLKKALNNVACADVVLCLKTGERYYALQTLLEARCPAFAKIVCRGGGGGEERSSQSVPPSCEVDDDDDDDRRRRRLWRVHFPTTTTTTTRTLAGAGLGTATTTTTTTTTTTITCDVGPNTLETLLEYLYLDELPDHVGWDNHQPPFQERAKAASLFAVARELDVPHMFALLEWHYSRTIDPSNAMWLACLALELEAEQLLWYAFHYIVSNRLVVPPSSFTALVVDDDDATTSGMTRTGV